MLLWKVCQFSFTVILLSDLGVKVLEKKCGVLGVLVELEVSV